MFQNKTPWWIALFVWCGLSTWWHVCKIKELCDDAIVAAPAYTIPALHIMDGDKLHLMADGNFGFKKSGADANFYNLGGQLDSLAAYLKANPGRKMTITGLYTSAEQNTTTFADLGLARADGIKQYLVKAGVPADSIATASKMTDLTFNSTDSTHNALAFDFGGLEIPASKTEEGLAAAEKYETVFEPMDLYFKTGSANYIKTDANQKFLKDAKAFLAKNAGKKLALTGHTDSEGRDDNNMKLSEKRANEVMHQLEKAGIPAAQLTVSAKGETEPKSSNETAEGRKANRRVAIVVQ
jgi:OOP family OmpA-OmpF porin